MNNNNSTPRSPGFSIPPGFQPRRRDQGGQPFDFPPGRPGQGGQPFDFLPGRPGQGGQPFDFPPGRPGQGGQQPTLPPMFPPGRPGQGQLPAAPPDFTPELPRMGSQPFSGRSDSTGQFDVTGALFRRRPRDFRGCLNRFTYIWLLNGNNFWFYPISSGRQFVEGFRWRRRGWVYDRINLNRILFFRCF